MKVNIVSYSQVNPELIDPINDYSLETQVAYCARVSNPSNQYNIDTNERLIKYLIKNKHWSPFEMVSICMEIETTRDISRQILRHRSFSFQEFSQRYADPTKEMRFEKREARLQDEKNRQNSLENNNKSLKEEWDYRQQVIIDAAESSYLWARSRNIAKEQARAILPEGCTSSRLYMNGSLRSWIHYIQVRNDPSTQKEHREVAKACQEEIGKIFPLIKNIS